MLYLRFTNLMSGSLLVILICHCLYKNTHKKKQNDYQCDYYIIFQRGEKIMTIKTFIILFIVG